MKKLKVIARRQLPTRLPILHTIVIALLLDRFNYPGWLIGAAALWLIVMWIGSVALYFDETEFELEELRDHP